MLKITVMMAATACALLSACAETSTVGDVSQASTTCVSDPIVSDGDIIPRCTAVTREQAEAGTIAQARSWGVGIDGVFGLSCDGDEVSWACALVTASWVVECQFSVTGDFPPMCQISPR